MIQPLSIDDSDLESPLREAVSQIIAEPIPADALLRAVERARQLTNSRSYTRTRLSRRAWVAAALASAGVAAAFVVVLLFVVSRPSTAFAELANAIVTAQSAQFKVAVKIDVPPNTELVQTGYFLAPNHFRQEGPQGFVVIGDFDRGRLMSLATKEKQAFVFELTGRSKKDKPAENFFGQLRELLTDYQEHAKTKDTETLGEKEIDGHKAIGFRIYWDGSTTTLWGDLKTGELVRVEASFAGPPKTVAVFSDFKLNVALDAALFDTDPPAGYKVMKADLNVSPPTEKDFVEALRRLTDATNGEYPAGFDIVAQAAAFGKMAKGKDDQESLKSLMSATAFIRRGLRFAMALPAEADAHYAGKNVKRQGPKVAIFWYKPEGSTKYRVLWSDLSIDDAEQPPDVQGAIELREKTECSMRA